MDDAVLVRAQHQGGVITAADIRSLGVPRAGVERAVRAGELVRVMAGGYRLPLTAPDPWGLLAHRQLARAALLLEPTAAAAAVTSLVAHQVDLFNPDLSRVHLSRPGPHIASRRAEVVRRTLPSGARVVATKGIRALDVASSLIQFITDVSHEQAVCAIDSALHQDLATEEALQERFAAVSRRAGPLRLARALRDSDRSAAPPAPRSVFSRTPHPWPSRHPSPSRRFEYLTRIRAGYSNLRGVSR